MSNYLTNYTESDGGGVLHVSNDEEEEAAAKAIAELRRQEKEAETEALRAIAAAKLAEKKICSCGHFSCPMRGRYGLPVPRFHDDIEPLFPQYRRDQRAVEIKQSEGI